MTQLSAFIHYFFESTNYPPIFVEAYAVLVLAGWYFRDVGWPKLMVRYYDFRLRQLDADCRKYGFAPERTPGYRDARKHFEEARARHAR